MPGVARSRTVVSRNLRRSKRRSWLLQPTPTAMIQHVTRQIAPSKLQACVEFYAMLGFVQVPVPPGIAGRTLWLERRQTQVHLMPVEGAGPAPGHVGILVDDYEVTV